MKPFGIGVDIVKVARLGSLLKKDTANRFLQKALHPEEIQRLHLLVNDTQKAQYLASRWAAKEALVKALRKKELDFAEVNVIK